MAILHICDVCGREPALDLSRHMPTMLDGKRILLALRADADEGEREPRRIDIGLVCLKKAVAGLMIAP